MHHSKNETSLLNRDKQDAALPGEVPVNTGKTVWNTSQVINQLDSGSHWSGGTITYSFPTNANWFPYSEANGFSQFSAAQKAAARTGIELWDDLIKPSFAETSNVSNSDIKFSNTTTNIGYAHAYFPGSWAGAGSIWLNGNSNSLQDPDIGEWGFMTILHELGHALGLDHAGDYNGGNPTYQNNASHAQDSLMFTIMSYFGEGNTGGDWQFGDGQYAEAQTPMVHDILAIQSIYGADTTTRTGDTVYGFNSNTGGDIFNFSKNKHPVLTIWDAGGKDTLDLSGFSDDAIVYLDPGSYSDAGGAVNNLAIAYDTWIENAAGGSGDDVITGNNLVNTINGNGGDDTLAGGRGGDTLYGDGGADRVSGNNGKDTVYGGDGNDNVRGNGGGDKLFGGNGNDTLTGGSGHDNLDGGAGNDKIVGSKGNDNLTGGGDTDTFIFNRPNWGQDIITDFANGSEQLDMRGSGVKANQLNVISSSGDAIVDFGGSDTITLLDEAGNINANDFIF